MGSSRQVESVAGRRPHTRRSWAFAHSPHRQARHKDGSKCVGPLGDAEADRHRSLGPQAGAVGVHSARGGRGADADEQESLSVGGGQGGARWQSADVPA